MLLLSFVILRLIWQNQFLMRILRNFCQKYSKHQINPYKTISIKSNKCHQFSPLLHLWNKEEYYKDAVKGIRNVIQICMWIWNTRNCLIKMFLLIWAFKGGSISIPITIHCKLRAEKIGKFWNFIFVKDNKIVYLPIISFVLVPKL